VSLVDLTFIAKTNTNREQVNQVIQQAMADDPQLNYIMDYITAPLVSVDFNHSAKSSSFDANHTQVQGNLVKVMAWYDNEWGFCNRMLDTSLALMHH
jgi:glyceraldehyde 3-phosphate dehydrogenase